MKMQQSEPRENGQKEEKCSSLNMAKTAENNKSRLNTAKAARNYKNAAV